MIFKKICKIFWQKHKGDPYDFFFFDSVLSKIRFRFFEIRNRGVEISTHHYYPIVKITQLDKLQTCVCACTECKKIIAIFNLKKMVRLA
jgi:hypothetical protein